MKTIQIDNKHYAVAKVVMLATDKPSNIYSITDGSLMYIDKLAKNNSGGNHKHLYILSNEEIREGDWYLFYMMDAPDLMQCRDKEEADRCNSHAIISDSSIKIIATTQVGLGEIPNSVPGFNFPDKKGLPQLSKEFIKAFIESYNNGKVIEDVLVEVNTISTGNFNERNQEVTDYELKLKDNTIIIKKKEEDWNGIWMNFIKTDQYKYSDNVDQVLGHYRWYLNKVYNPPTKKPS